MPRCAIFRLWAAFLALSPLLATSAFGQAGVPLAPAANLSEVALAPGDMIRLSFWREPALNGDYLVDESGRVVLPIIGARYVSSTAPVDLIDRLTQDYDEYLNNQQVNITFLRRIRILGSVQNPGIYHINPTMSLSDALALAGGARPEGKLSAIELIRGSTKVRTNLDQVGSIAPHIQSGDQIFVPERSWFSRHSRVIVGGVLSAATLVITQALIR